MFHPVYNYGYSTEPDPNMNNRNIYWRRGRGLGGLLSINGLIYIRCEAADYDRWSAAGTTVGAGRSAAVLHQERAQQR